MEFKDPNQSNRMQDLITGYALNILDDKEYAEAQQLLKTNLQARQLLIELGDISNQLALSAAPVDLPEGSLNRLRQKANLESDKSNGNRPSSGNSVPPTINPSVPPKIIPFIRPGWLVAASIFFFFTSVVLLVFWLIANTNASANERNNRELLALLSARNLKVSELISANGQVTGNLRLYVSTADNKAYLVVQNLASLPNDKEYEAWFITDNSEIYKAGLLGNGGAGKPVAFELEASKAVAQYKVIAITIEPKGGVSQPTQPPIFRGDIG